MDNWFKGSSTVNGINIHYLRTGGEKPPVILLHGLLMNGACWTPLARALEQDYDVIMPDSRGHGNSSAPRQGYNYETLATDLLSFIQSLKLVSPVLIGHSMGGMTAATAAGQNSEQLQGLVLADPTFLTPPLQKEVYKSDLVIQHLRILKQPKEDYLDTIRIRQKHRSSELHELFAQARFQTSVYAFEILKPPNPDYNQLIKSLHLPTLLVFGDRGAVISPSEASKLAKLNQCLEIIQIQEAGHGLPYDQPVQFLATVKKFLKKIALNVSLF
jgi:N-formylmaleamate deformylase